MDQPRKRYAVTRSEREWEADPLASIGRLVGEIGAEIEVLKQEREADHVRSARMRIGAVHARARLEKRAVPN